MKKQLRIFFAIPFDLESMSMYKKSLIPRLLKKYQENPRLECVIGNQVIGAPELYGVLETFKMQNTELFRHFVKGIREADIVIADLTGNNPNVHVELGIALSYNKNILRVTREPYEHLPFDVSGYEVFQYKVKKDLFDKLDKYVGLFLQIKNLDFDDFRPELSKLFYDHPERKSLKWWENDVEKSELTGARDAGKPIHKVPIVNTEFPMRDGKVQVAFNITDQASGEDWFGVFLRVGDMGSFYGSILVYVRKDGRFEVATYPGTKIIGEEKLPGECDGDKMLTIELDGHQIKANVDGIELINKEDITIQSPGVVKFASWFSNAEFWDAKIVCRDTIEAFDIFG